MANETEELRLIVSLVDNATPGVQRIRRELNLLNNVSKDTAGGVDRLNKSFEGFDKETEKASRSARGLVAQFTQVQHGVRGLASSIASLDLRGFTAGIGQLSTSVGGLGQALGGVGGAARAAGLAVSGVTAAILAGVVAVVGYKKAVFDLAQELKGIGDTARSLGMSAGEFKALTDQAARYGITADQVARSIQNMQDKLLDLHTTGSDLRRKLLREGLDPNWIRQYMAADEANQLRMGREKALEIEQSVIRRGYGRGVAAAARRRFEGDVGIGGELVTQQGAPFTRGDPAQIEKVNEAAKNARDMAVAWNDLAIKAEHMKFDTLAGGIKGVTTDLEAAKGLMESMDRTSRSIAESWGKISEGLKNAVPRDAQHDLTPNEDLAPIKLFGGGDFQHEGMNEWPMSTNIEDRRINATEDATDQTKLLVDQLKILNENIRPGSSTRMTAAGGGGAGAAPAGGGAQMPGGMQSLLSPPGSAPINTANVPSGAPPASPGAGSSPSPQVGGSFTETRPGAGAPPMGGGGPPMPPAVGGGDTAGRVSPGGKTAALHPPGGSPIAGTPGTPGQALDLAMTQVGLHERKDRDAVRNYLKTGDSGVDPATTAWCAAFVNSSLQQANIKGSGSAIATSFLRWGQGVKPGDIQKGDVLVQPHGRGYMQTGGHVGMATGNVDPKTGRIEMLSGNKGDAVRRSWENPRGIVARRAFGAELDRTLGNEVTANVKGSAKVSVDVKAPPGTNVDSSGDGVLRDITTTRQVQMPPTNDLSRLSFGGGTEAY